MVGTRHPTPYGSGMAERLACDLTAQGLVILSGMACGVNTASDCGAIAAKGRQWRCSSRASGHLCPGEFALVETDPRPRRCSSRSFRSIPSPRRKTSPSATASSAACRLECLYSRLPNIPERATRPVARSSKIVRSSPFPATSRTRIHGVRIHGSSRAPSWSRPGRTCGRNSRQKYDLPQLPASSSESQSASCASLFPDEGLPTHEKRILSLLKADEATHIDEIVERLETEISSSEIFPALFELELTRQSKANAGEESCEGVLAISCQLYATSNQVGGRTRPRGVSGISDCGRRLMRWPCRFTTSAEARSCTI